MFRRSIAQVGLLLLLLSAGKSAQATSLDAARAAKLVNKPAREDAEALLDMLLSFAKHQLEKNGEFFPFGAAVLPTGRLAAVAVKPTEERPPSQKVIDDLLQAFRAGARKQMYLATGMAIDVRTIPPGETQKTDAVEVRLDDVSGYSVHVVVPYKLVNRVVTFGTPFATAGDNDVFPHSVH